MITVSVVMPATNTPPTLARCVAAIERAGDGPDEVIVVDGPRQLSASGARNAGARRATGDVVVFVDADVEVQADAFTRIRAAFAADPRLTALFGSYDEVPAAPGTVSAFRNLLHHHVHHRSAGPADTFWTGLGAVRREAFLAVGGFDAVRFPHPSIEDIELGNRLAAAGAHIVLDPAIQGTHLKAWRVRTMVWTDVVRRGIPWVALQTRTGRISSALNCGWRHRLSAAAFVALTTAAVLVRPLVVVAALGSIVALNRSFYGLLLRRRGLGEALVGVGLHGVYHLCAVVALPPGILLGLGSRLAAALRAIRAATGAGVVTRLDERGYVPLVSQLEAFAAAAAAIDGAAPTAHGAAADEGTVVVDGAGAGAAARRPVAAEVNV